MRKYNFYTGCRFNSKWCNGMEKQQRNGTALGYVAVCIILFWIKRAMFDSRAACFNIRFWISRVRRTSIEIPNLRRGLLFAAILRVCSLSPPATLLHRSPLSSHPFRLSVPKTTLRYARYFREPRIAFFLIGGTRFVAHGHTDSRIFFFFFVSSLYIPLFDSRTAFSTAFFDISRKFQQHRSFVMAVTTVGRV